MGSRRVQRTVGGAGASRCRNASVAGRGIVALVAVLGVLVSWCASAQAKLIHPYLSSFGSFASVEGVAVESETGTVYVYDGGAGTVYKFDAAGSPVNFTATGTNALTGVGLAFSAEGEIAVDSSPGPAKGDIYVAHAEGSIAIYSAAGSKLGELTEESGRPWGEACGVAVDGSGRVYVGLYSSNVNVYVPSANPVTDTDYITSLNGVNGVCNIAADSAANVFVDTWERGPVTRYEPNQFGAASASGSIVDEAGSTVAVDPANDDVYVDEQDQVAQYGPHGKPFQAPVITFASSGSGAISSSYGIAVSGFNSDVYVSDGKGAISVFGPLTLENVPPALEDQYVTDVSGTSATLGAHLNAEGRDTVYHFEYGLSTSYGSSTPEADAGSSLASEAVQVHLQKLQIATVYHYRLVATNSAGTVYGPDRTFTTQRSGDELGLLDGRQWELVSPANKHGAEIYPITKMYLPQASEDGSAFAWTANAPTESGPEGYANDVRVMSVRGSEGWSSKDIPTPHSAPAPATVSIGNEYRFFSPDLSSAVVEPQGPFTPLSADATDRTPYIRRACDSASGVCYTPLVTAANVPPGTDFGGPEAGTVGEPKFVDATGDLSHVVVESQRVGLTSTPGDEGGLYEWIAGQLQIVSVLPEGEGGSPVADASLGYYPFDANSRNALSADGSRIFWEDRVGRSAYMRDTAKQETLRLGINETIFQIASSDGSHVFFGGRSSFGEPYALEECDVVRVAGKLACDVTQLAPELQGEVMAATEDGSNVYFVSNAALAPGAVSGECGGYPPRATASCNLYVDRRGASGWEGPKLIAVLSGRDESDWGNAVQMTARLSPNGRWLTFMSQRGLTGYDTRDAVTGEPDQEVYVYDSMTETLRCASCNPTGARPNGSEYEVGEGESEQYLMGGGAGVSGGMAANVPGRTRYELVSALYQSRYLDDDGRLFFNSGDALVPQDVNGTWDVYEYEPPGVGSCSTGSVTFSVSAGGCVDLVSSGTSPDQSAFMDAGEGGGDVFFMTTSHLTNQDFDTGYDIYDAHACSTGAPCFPSVVSPPPCGTGDSCKSAPSPQPGVFGSPPSATFAGIGNVTVSHEALRPRSLTRAQKLKRALRACHKRRSRHKRMACRRRARKRYRVKKAMRGSR